MNIIKWIKAKIYHYQMTYKRNKEQMTWNKKIKVATIDFPYIVEFEGDWSFCGYMDSIGEWCINNIGNCNGECEWYSCNNSFDKWYDKTNLDSELDKMLEGTSDNQMRNIIDEHYKNVHNIKGCPDEFHSHSGSWVAYCIKKTGYDAGIFRFYFKNVKDAIHCKMIWGEK